MPNDSGGYQATDNDMDVDDLNFKRKRQYIDDEENLQSKKDFSFNSHDKNNILKNDQSSESNIRPKVYYTDKDSGTISVWIKKIKAEGDALSAYKVGSILYKVYKNIIDIRKRGKFIVEVVCKNYLEANSIIDDKKLKSSGLETFVPGYRKIRKGIVRGIPTDLDTQEIHDSCESSAKVLEVKRLNRRNKNSTSDEDKWIPCSSVVVTFAGQILPTEITLFKVKSSVEPFVNKPTQCFNCFQFNHTSKFCKNDASCIQCGELKHDNNCKHPVPKCVNCGEDHKSIDSTCSVFQKYHKINVIMAFDNVSFYEAKKQVFGDNNENIALRKTKENFPSLREKNLNKFSRSYSDTTKATLKKNPKFNMFEPSSYKNSSTAIISKNTNTQENESSFAFSDDPDFNSQDFIQNSQSHLPLNNKKKNEPSRTAKKDDKENDLDLSKHDLNSVKFDLNKGLQKVDTNTNTNLSKTTVKLSERLINSQNKNFVSNNGNNRGGYSGRGRKNHK